MHLPDGVFLTAIEKQNTMKKNYKKSGPSTCGFGQIEMLSFSEFHNRVFVCFPVRK